MVMADNSSEDDRTIWVGNVHSKVTEELLWELFLQAGPLESVKIPKDFKTGRQKNFAFVKFQHRISVPYVIDLMGGIPLFDMPLKLCRKNKPSANGNTSNDNQQHDAIKRRRMDEEAVEQYHFQGPLTNHNFPGHWGMMPPHLMVEHPMQSRHPHPAHWRQQSFQSHSGHRDRSPHGRQDWDNREKPRPSSRRREREDAAIHRSHSTPNRLHEEDFDRRRGDPYARHERHRK